MNLDKIKNLDCEANKLLHGVFETEEYREYRKAHAKLEVLTDMQYAEMVDGCNEKIDRLLRYIFNCARVKNFTIIDYLLVNQDYLNFFTESLWCVNLYKIRESLSFYTGKDYVDKALPVIEKLLFLAEFISENTNSIAIDYNCKYLIIHASKKHFLQEAGLNLEDFRVLTEWVYVLRDQSGLIKIGKSSNLIQRIQQIISVNPLVTPISAFNTLICQNVELIAQKKFDSERVCNEFFKSEVKDVEQFLRKYAFQEIRFNDRPIGF